ncbi:spaetzle-processing enzyme [Drosophila grimshawi]|uniref:GH16014 n=1 Tax=Drosophila grimshawi TaxID=7222 RepID=B4JUD3_DROGR|nr:spaetzle-processing enzyme [Drosophila grimshawi]EDV91103.1 GH16014 [Drosophila grimshawi]
MNTTAKLVGLLISIMLSVKVNAVTIKCGNLNEALLYSKETTTSPNEYPWMGVLLESEDGYLRNTRCSVIIVGEAHVLATGPCVRRKRPELLTVRLGLWNKTHVPGERIQCNEKGFCVPRPVDHRVKGILEHSLADKETGDYDLAILELKELIKMTTYIQPLCVNQLPVPESLIGRNYHYGGFDNASYLKGKGLAITISRQVCTETGKLSSAPPANQFCAYPEKRTRFYNGAALMSTNVKGEVPRNFYLSGIMTKHLNVGDTTLLFFHDIKSVRQWILNNTRITGN